jgi:hypothetical protein
MIRWTLTSQQLPLWFQAIKGVTPVQSGINTLPMIISLVAGTIVAGTLTQRTGYYVPQLLTSTVLLSTGTGLLTTLQVDTNHSKWIGYQIIYGFGLGLGMQQAGMAAQTCLSKKDVMTGVSIMFFMQGLGGAIWLSVAQTIFDHSLVINLRGVADLDPAMIVKTGATDLRNLVPAESLPAVLVAYNSALSTTFKLAVGCAVATIIAGATMEWRNIKGMKNGEAAPRKAEKDEETGDAAAVADGGEKNTESRPSTSEIGAQLKETAV